MNWKKALLITVLAVFALVFFAVAAVGFAATAAVTAAAVAISESDVVQAFEEVADGAERLQIDIDENSLTVTNLDSGESRTVVGDGQFGRGRVDFNLPEITITDADGGQSVVFSPGQAGEGEVSVPQITITDPDSGQSRVIRPNMDFQSEFRAPRVVWDPSDVWDGDYDWHDFDHEFGPGTGLRIVGGFFRGLFNLTALVLIVAGAFLLLRNRNRRQAQDKLDQVDKTG